MSLFRFRFRGRWGAALAMNKWNVWILDLKNEE
jgi:hypothetical protein